MSRIGKLPVEIPAGVTVNVADDNTVTVKGPKGELKQKFNGNIKLEEENGVITVTRPNDHKQNRALHGLTRALLNNMVIGVTQGFTKNLEVVGVGYRAAMQGTELVLNVGYSHQVNVAAPAGIKFEVPQANQIVVSGIDKQQVGQIAADIRAVRPPEPYKGKGIRYKGEVVRHKEGKTGM